MTRCFFLVGRSAVNRKRMHDSTIFPHTSGEIEKKEFRRMKATGIVRRIDDLGRVVIPKEIRRTMRIREGDPLLTSLTPLDRGVYYIGKLCERTKKILFLEKR